MYNCYSVKQDVCFGLRKTLEDCKLGGGDVERCDEYAIERDEKDASEIRLSGIKWMRRRFEKTKKRIESSSSE